MEPHSSNRRAAPRISAQSLNITGKLQSAGGLVEDNPVNAVATFDLVDVSRVGYRLQTAKNPGLGSQVLVSFDQGGRKHGQALWDLFDEDPGQDNDDAPCLGVVVWRKSVESGYEVGIQVEHCQ